MRKVLFIGRMVLVYLLLGFVTTWAVAWAIALIPVSNESFGHSEFSQVGSSTFESVRCSVDRGPGSLRIAFVGWRGELDDVSHALFEQTSFVGSNADDHDRWLNPNFSWSVQGFRGWGQRQKAAQRKPTDEWSRGFDDGRGFPALALWCSWRAKEHNQMLAIDSDRPVFGGISISNLPGVPGPPIPRALPYYPIWSGLALNTAFYALLFFVCVRLFKGTRHLLRFRKGRCPRCGYNLVMNFSQPCSECGHEACKRTVSTA